MTTNEKNHIRSLFNEISYQRSFTARFLREHDTLTQAEQNAILQIRDEQIRRIRRNISRFYANREDPLRESMLTGARRRISNGDDMCNAFTEYWIDTDTSRTDDEAREICRDERIDFSSPDDCTGHLFTSCISFNRTPCGIAFVHVLHYDY